MRNGSGPKHLAVVYQMRRFFFIAAVGACLGMAAIWAYGSAGAKREAGYRAALQVYSQDLKPGQTRKEVEAYFHAKNVRFGQICCIGQPQHAWADLVKTGDEWPMLICSEFSINVAFEFRAMEPHLLPESRDNDVLESVRLFSLLRGCP
jgi:hypothetical protein